MSDYRNLTDDEINREIAERRGFHVFGLTITDNGPMWGPGREWLDEWIVVDGEVQALPNVANDLNAAIGLLKDMGGSLAWDSDAWRVADAALDNPYARHEQATRACCLAWLSWWDIVDVKSGAGGS